MIQNLNHYLDQLPENIRLKLQSKFQEFSRFPTSTNAAFMTGYLAALEDQMPPETYTFFLALIGQIETQRGLTPTTVTGLAPEGD